MIVEFGLTMMQSVVESWTHNADPAICLLSEAQIEENGVKRVVIRPDASFFDKLVGLSERCEK